MPRPPDLPQRADHGHGVLQAIHAPQQLRHTLHLRVPHVRQQPRRRALHLHLPARALKAAGLGLGQQQHPQRRIGRPDRRLHEASERHGALPQVGGLHARRLREGESGQQVVF